MVGVLVKLSRDCRCLTMAELCLAWGRRAAWLPPGRRAGEGGRKMVGRGVAPEGGLTASGGVSPLGFCRLSLPVSSSVLSWSCEGRRLCRTGSGPAGERSSSVAASFGPRPPGAGGRRSSLPSELSPLGKGKLGAVLDAALMSFVCACIVSRPP